MIIIQQIRETKTGLAGIQALNHSKGTCVVQGSQPDGLG